MFQGSWRKPGSVCVDRICIAYLYSVYMCFVDLEKVYDRVPKGILCELVLREYGVRETLLRARQSHSVVCTPKARVVFVCSGLGVSRISFRWASARATHCQLLPPFCTALNKLWKKCLVHYITFLRKNV